MVDKTLRLPEDERQAPCVVCSRPASLCVVTKPQRALEYCIACAINLAESMDMSAIEAAVVDAERREETVP